MRFIRPRSINTLRQGATLIVANERFVETVRRLELDGVLFHELEVR